MWDVGRDKATRNGWRNDEANMLRCCPPPVKERVESAVVLDGKNAPWHGKDMGEESGRVMPGGLVFDLRQRK